MIDDRCETFGSRQRDDEEEGIRRHGSRRRAESKVDCRISPNRGTWSRSHSNQCLGRFINVS